MKLDYTTLILLLSDQKDSDPNLASRIDSVLTIKCNSESKLYGVRGNTISSVILKGIRFAELSELARNTILASTSTARVLGNEVSVIEFDNQGRLLSINVLHKIDAES